MGLWGGGRRRAAGVPAGQRRCCSRLSPKDRAKQATPHLSADDRFLVARTYDMAPTAPDTRGNAVAGDGGTIHHSRAP